MHPDDHQRPLGQPAEVTYLEELTGEDAHNPPALDVVVLGKVRTEERTAQSWTAANYPLGTSPQRVAPDHQLRDQLRIVNVGANPVWIGPGPAVTTPTVGFLLPPNVPILLETSAEVWACATDAAPSTLSILGTFRDGS